MIRIKSVTLSLLLALMIFSSALELIPGFSAPGKVSPVTGKVRELMLDHNRELYIDRIILSEILDTEEQKISVNLLCKNLLTEPSSCVDIFFFSLLDTSGNHYQAKLAESRIMAARIQTRDIVQGILTFVIPRAENATQLIYSEPKGSNFLVDLSSAKDPADKPPIGEWRLVRNKGLTLSDSRIELKIYNETRTQDNYVLEISIQNKGYGIVNYNALYAYLKSASGSVFGAALYADVEPKIESGTLQPGQHVRGKISFDVGNESGPFMLIYDDIAGSYFATGEFVPLTSSEVIGEIIGTDDLIKISKHNKYLDPSTGAYKIIGEVSNDSGSFVTEIQIHAILKDKSGNVLAELDHTLTNFLSSTPTNLAPNARIPFFLEFSLPKTAIKNISSYELSLRYSLSEPKNTVLFVSSAELVQASKPTPLSRYVLWQIKGQIANTGDVRSTHTQITASLYDSKGSIIGVGGFSVLDQQPRDLIPSRIGSFSIEIAVPTAFKPLSFYLYAESDQFAITESKTYGKAEEELKPSESLPVQSQNHTLIKIISKQREDIMQLVIKNLPNSTSSVYGIQILIKEESIHILKAKLRWDSKEIAGNELLLNTVNNPIKPGQRAKFLFSLDNDLHLVVWKALDFNGAVLLEGEVKPFQVNYHAPKGRAS